MADSFKSTKSAISVLLIVTFTGGLLAQPLTPPQQPQASPAAVPPAESTDVEVLSRGPVHEAFAEPVNLQGVEPLQVQKAPPQAVEELPPDQKPEGDNVQWITGYWAWDEDRDNYIWISGVWRDIPPGQRWVPGYWSDTGRGYTWTPGFWASEKVNEVQYLPEPPNTLEEGPQITAPTANHIWVPGCWRYYETRYVWRPGYWTPGQPQWIWIPARYVWCPRGYIFVDGYWDYPLEERGVLFAPVYYRQPIFVRPAYYYTPSVVISCDILTVHLFARPRYCHYYFGDYYAPHYRHIGIEPWCMYPRIRSCYDPLFAHYSWRHRRHGRDWDRECHDRYDFFAKHKDFRPAHTYADLRRQRFDKHRIADADIQNVVAKQTDLAVNLNQYVEKRSRDLNVGVDNRGRDRGRFTKVDDQQRRNFRDQADRVRDFTHKRTQVETASTGGPDLQTGKIGDLGTQNRDGRSRRTLNLADLQQNGSQRDNSLQRDGSQRNRDRARIDVPPALERTAGEGVVSTPIQGSEQTGNRPRDFRSRGNFGRSDQTKLRNTGPNLPASDSTTGANNAPELVGPRNQRGDNKLTTPGSNNGDVLDQLRRSRSESTSNSSRRTWQSPDREGTQSRRSEFTAPSIQNNEALRDQVSPGPTFRSESSQRFDQRGSFPPTHETEQTPPITRHSPAGGNPATPFSHSRAGENPAATSSHSRAGGNPLQRNSDSQRSTFSTPQSDIRGQLRGSNYSGRTIEPRSFDPQTPSSFPRTRESSSRGDFTPRTDFSQRREYSQRSMPETRSIPDTRSSFTPQREMSQRSFSGSEQSFRGGGGGGGGDQRGRSDNNRHRNRD